MARIGQSCGRLAPPCPQGPPSQGSLTLNPSPHPPTQCPLSLWEWWGPDTPMSPSPLAQLDRATCSRSPGRARRGLWRPCGPAPLLPQTPKMRSPLRLIMGCRKLWRGKRGAGIPSFWGGFRKEMEHPKSGETRSLGSSTQQCRGRGWDRALGSGGHTGGHSPIPAP